MMDFALRILRPLSWNGDNRHPTQRASVQLMDILHFRDLPEAIVSQNTDKSHVVVRRKDGAALSQHIEGNQNTQV